MKIKDIIRERRIQLGLTQKELAEKLGTNFAYINRLENGTHYKHIKKLDELFKILELDLEFTLNITALTDKKIKK